MRRKTGIAEAAKVAALCLPPVILSLIGLAAMGRKPHRQDMAAAGKSATTIKPRPPRHA